jgi:hypothetical protein
VDEDSGLGLPTGQATMAACVEIAAEATNRNLMGVRRSTARTGTCTAEAGGPGGRGLGCLKSGWERVVDIKVGREAEDR